MELEKEYYEIEDYGGFLLRLVAYLIDSIIVGVVCSIIAALFIGPKAAKYSMMDDDPTAEELINMFGDLSLLPITIIVLQWLYFALMESSANQGTIGKIAVGIKVTDLNGDPIGFGRATGRHFGKIISSLILLIGYIMILFTEKRQGLHDILAGALVLKKKVPPLA